MAGNPLKRFRCVKTDVGRIPMVVPVEKFFWFRLTLGGGIKLRHHCDITFRFENAGKLVPLAARFFKVFKRFGGNDKIISSVRVPIWEKMRIVACRLESFPLQQCFQNGGVATTKIQNFFVSPMKSWAYGSAKTLSRLSIAWACWLLKFCTRFSTDTKHRCRL